MNNSTKYNYSPNSTSNTIQNQNLFIHSLDMLGQDYQNQCQKKLNYKNSISDGFNIKNFYEIMQQNSRQYISLSRNKLNILSDLLKMNIENQQKIKKIQCQNLINSLNNKYQHSNSQIYSDSQSQQNIQNNQPNVIDQEINILLNNNPKQSLLNDQIDIIQQPQHIINQVVNIQEIIKKTYQQDMKKLNQLEKIKIGQKKANQKIVHEKIKNLIIRQTTIYKNIIQYLKQIDKKALQYIFECNYRQYRNDKDQKYLKLYKFSEREQIQFLLYLLYEQGYKMNLSKLTLKKLKIKDKKEDLDQKLVSAIRQQCQIKKLILTQNKQLRLQLVENYIIKTQEERNIMNQQQFQTLLKQLQHNFHIYLRYVNMRDVKLFVHQDMHFLDIIRQVDIPNLKQKSKNDLFLLTKLLIIQIMGLNMYNDCVRIIRDLLVSKLYNKQVIGMHIRRNRPIQRLKTLYHCQKYFNNFIKQLQDKDVIENLQFQKQQYSYIKEIVINKTINTKSIQRQKMMPNVIEKPYKQMFKDNQLYYNNLNQMIEYIQYQDVFDSNYNMDIQ